MSETNSGNLQQERKSGMNCPQCGAFIEISMFQLIMTNALVCPACRLRLNIDRGRSQRAIAALRKLQAAQDNLESTTKSDGSQRPGMGK
ncbi:MAG: hypothetical protein OSJ36_05760 [Odoribacter sp.]|nr:hypothetical protein [Odoribacter sp.]